MVEWTATRWKLRRVLVFTRKPTSVLWNIISSLVPEKIYLIGDNTVRIALLFRSILPCVRFVEERRVCMYPSELFARCWAFVAVCERRPVLTGRQQSYPYLPIADVLFTIHVVYSKNRTTAVFKIWDAKSKIARKKSGLFRFLWYPVVLTAIGLMMMTILKGTLLETQQNQ